MIIVITEGSCVQDVLGDDDWNVLDLDGINSGELDWQHARTLFNIGHILGLEPALLDKLEELVANGEDEEPVIDYTAEEWMATE